MHYLQGVVFYEDLQVKIYYVSLSSRFWNFRTNLILKSLQNTTQSEEISSHRIVVIIVRKQVG